MQGPERSHIGKFILLFLAVLCMAACSSEKAGPPLAGPTVVLPAVELEAFGALPPVKPAAVTPACREQTGSLDRAVNYRQVLAFLEVRLSAEQRKFLIEHRFLLVPKSATAFKGRVDLGSGEGNRFDEMLGLFDYLGGETNPFQRRPENCRFVNPDAMLHAFHKYLENSLEYLEKTELAAPLRRFLKNLQAKALEYRAGASGPQAEH
jgi:hypothetical protein